MPRSIVNSNSKQYGGDGLFELHRTGVNTLKRICLSYIGVYFICGYIELTDRGVPPVYGKIIDGDIGVLHELLLIDVYSKSGKSQVEGWMEGSGVHNFE